MHGQWASNCVPRVLVCILPWLLVCDPRCMGGIFHDAVRHGISPSECRVTTHVGIAIAPSPTGMLAVPFLVCGPATLGWFCGARSLSLSPSPVAIAWLRLCRLRWPFPTAPGLDRSSSNATPEGHFHALVFAHLSQQQQHHLQRYNNSHSLFPPHSYLADEHSIGAGCRHHATCCPEQMEVGRV